MLRTALSIGWINSEVLPLRGRCRLRLLVMVMVVYVFVRTGEEPPFQQPGSPWFPQQF